MSIFRKLSSVLLASTLIATAFVSFTAGTAGATTQETTSSLTESSVDTSSVSQSSVDPGVFCGFVDVPYDAFFTTPTCWLKERNITTGTSLTEYSPAGLVTRAQMAAFLWRAVGEPAAPNHVFRDETSIGSWARAATDWLYAQNITREDPFNPAGTLSRAEMAVWLWKASGSPAAPNRVFKDEAQIPISARVATDWLYQQGITTNDPYKPFGTVNRAQMAAFLHRFTGNQTLSADTLSNTDGSAAVLWYRVNGAANRTITLPVHGTGSITVDWGDGTTPQVVANPNRPTKTFAADGFYRVKVTGSATGFGFEDKSFPLAIPAEARQLLAASNFGELGTTDMSGGFYGAVNLVRAPQKLPATVTNLAGAFMWAEKFNAPIASWNTSNVTNTALMFYEATSFNQPIGNWNTVNVTDMDSMFSRATAFNQPIGNWNTGNVTDMGFMFSGARSFNQPIGSWNTANVTRMDYMFYGATAFNRNISTWNVTKVANWYYFRTNSSLTTANTPPKFR